LPAVDPEEWIREVREGLLLESLAPYLGPGVTALSRPPVPSSEQSLADYLGTKVALPRRARGQLGPAAQFIESSRHRSVVLQLLTDAFATPLAPLPFHRWLAEQRSPLIVDTWYDGAMREALAKRSHWGEIQGVRRSGLGGDQYYSAYDASGVKCPIEEASRWETVLYKPHGAITPAKNFLASDSDYVEVLTEIDIQTPIPAAVRDRRSQLGFVLFGCRLNDQTLRSYARQILKRSREPHFIVVEPGLTTRNERRFIREHRMKALTMPLAEVLGRLTPS
jgi:hypothetical protein